MPDGSRSRFGKLSEKWKYLLNAPFKISAKCCDVIKKKPFVKYERRTGRVMMTGESADNSRRRFEMYLQHGCNGFEMKRPKSTPLGFWVNGDMFRYLRDFKVPYCNIYGEIVEKGGSMHNTGVRSTGCMFCMFGVHMEGPCNRFMRMQETHPQLWDYCINKLGCGKVLNYIGVPYSGMSFGREFIR
jgi:3'-phosphoadenosine 5'-phosphosulfate sulfotransferase (PAPS reductase)/FAD synthetase